MSPKRIDIIQQFVDLYKNEKMLAFFEFAIGGVSGLCKVSTPKGGGTAMRYLSLTFMVDAPDDDTRVAVDEALAAIEGDALEKAIPAVMAVVPVPAMVRGSENYVRQVDVMLKDAADPDRPFIAERLLPAVLQLTQMTAREIVWWDDESAATAGAKAPAAGGEHRSLLGTLKARVRK